MNLAEQPDFLFFPDSVVFFTHRGRRLKGGWRVNSGLPPFFF
jgi:hypothetical protein